jgi:AcrR family transcriptional regulator
VASRSRTRLDVDARRNQLIEIGLELFSTRPYDEVWIEEIAERAGISRGLLYHYFPTKRDFYVEVVRSAVDDVYAATEPDVSVPPLERLRASVDAYLDYAETHAHGVLTTHRAGVGADPEVRAVMEAAWARQSARIVEAVAGHTDVPPTLFLAVRGWLGFLATAAAAWLEKRDIERDTLRDLLVNSLVGMILAARQADPELGRMLPPPVDE